MDLEKERKNSKIKLTKKSAKLHIIKKSFSQMAIYEPQKPLLFFHTN